VDPDPDPVPPSGELLTASRAPGGVRVTGWASDGDGVAVHIAVTIDGVEVGQLTADRP
jgi:hypothetical protein